MVLKGHDGCTGIQDSISALGLQSRGKDSRALNVWAHLKSGDDYSVLKIRKGIFDEIGLVLRLPTLGAGLR